MIRPIMKMQVFLQQPSADAEAADLDIAQDLVDTLKAHRPACVGMAANMIGKRKRIIAVVDDDDRILVMLNPYLIHWYGEYETKEGCLSLEGLRPTKRYKRILVGYNDTLMRSCQAEFTGRVAQAIQHEIDHTNGVLI
ncbi:MAG: peptide deformylase [Eggerthellaceae bacterium]|nr:peptide deformylase [Eggerthellaceae bacterium]